jgi:hypothetical protein
MGMMVIVPSSNQNTVMVMRASFASHRELRVILQASVQDEKKEKGIKEQKKEKMKIERLGFILPSLLSIPNALTPC